MSRILAVDLGGSALKAGLLTFEGMVEASVAFPVGFDEDGTGRSEQHPERWWRAFTDAVEALAARSGLDGLAAVVACGATRTQVFLDARGRPVRPAIGFRDTRSHRAAEQALHLPGVADHPEAKHLDRFHPLARLLWLRETEPDAWAATRTVLEPKDWLVLRLTGQAASDPISQERLAAAFAGDQGSLAALAGIDRAVLPPLRPPQGRIGTARTGLGGALEGLAGVPVFCGSHDTWCAVAGLGALASGCGYCVSGSSETAGLLSPRPARADGLLTVRWGDGLWQIGGPGLNGANVMDWLARLLVPGDGPPERRVMQIVPAAPSDRPLVFHPYLNGERTPYWDADLRGALLGLDRDHGPADIARAVMEGVALLNREVLERAGQAAGIRAERVFLAGGGARNHAWTQIRADVLGREIVVPHDVDAGLAGCLAVARAGLGHFADVTEAARSITLEPRSVYPNPAMRDRCDALWESFRATHPLVVEASHRLAGVPAPAIPAVVAP